MNPQNDTTQSNELVITRTVNAPRELVFDCFTQADHLSKWWGPKGFEFINATLELNPGGIFHYCMKSPDGFEMWGKFVFVEIESPERLVFINSFSDADGATTRAFFNPNWPLEVLNAVTFQTVGHATQITLRGGPINATEAELAAFAEHIASMQQGFGATFDQLDEYLTTL